MRIPYDKTNFYKNGCGEYKPLSNFCDGDTIFVSKPKNKFVYTFRCTFVSSTGKTVKVRPVVVTSPEWAEWEFPESGIFTVKIEQCYIWRKPADLMWAICHWFKDFNSLPE